MKQQRRQRQQQGRPQKQLRARLRTEQMRQAHDALDLPREILPAPGKLPLDDTPERTSFDLLAGDYDDAPRQLTLADSLRSRPPVVHLRLVERESAIDVVVTAQPQSAKMREALQELADLLRFIFNVKRAAFTDAEWAGLLHGQDTTPAQRLVLLTRLAISADTRIHTARVPFLPSDRSLKRFHARFAALPDGTPFSLRLLLQDLRGKRARPASGRSGFLELPDALLLLAVRRALAAEAQDRQARSDYEIGPLLRRALEELGVVLPSAPTEEEVRTLRERRAWKALDLFPKAARRQRSYVGGGSEGQSP